MPKVKGKARDIFGLRKQEYNAHEVHPIKLDSASSSTSTPSASSSRNATPTQKDYNWKNEIDFDSFY